MSEDEMEVEFDPELSTDEERRRWCVYFAFGVFQNSNTMQHSEVIRLARQCERYLLEGTPQHLTGVENE